jgi:sensor histidine kinase YesM
MDAMPGPPQRERRGLARAFAWSRLRVVLVVAFLASLPLSLPWTGSYRVLFFRLLIVGLVLLVPFAVFERRPKRRPRWLEPWMLQVASVALTVPVALVIAYIFTSAGYETSFEHDKERMLGFGMLLGASLFLAPWTAMLALLKQVTGEARTRALAFELERSELERQALDARMRVLQAQVEPHFLFNTLANVRELVDSGSPQASSVLASLIAYLRAAVPRMHEPATTFAQELQLVRAYLEVMQMRIPDRLQFVLHAEDAVLALQCPPMSLLTLVENAVRHGIDPSEEGGRIEVRVTSQDSRVRAQVCDSGVGLGQDTSVEGLGTGLATLRERLRLLFGDSASVRLDPQFPRGACAEMEFPARTQPAP